MQTKYLIYLMNPMNIKDKIVKRFTRTKMIMAEELLFDKSLSKIKFLYNLTGINIETRKKSRKQTFVFIFNFLWLNTDIVGCLHWAMLGIINKENFTEIAFVAPCLTLSILGDIKGLLLSLNENKVHKLINNLRDLERKKNKFNIADEDDVIKPEIKFLEVVTKVLNVLNCMMIVVFDLSPLILIAVKYYRSGELQLMLPFLDVYPFDSFDLRFWPFAYIHQIWSECIVLLEICATDYFFFTCCTHIRVQFKLLHQQFQNIVRETSATEYGVDRKDLKIKFIKLIKWHQQIISSANMLEGVYSKSTLFNFVTSSFVICLTGFNATIIDDIAFVMTFMTFLFMSLLQIFFLCLFGDILMSSSTEVTNAVYNCLWYLSSTAAGRNVLIIQTRSQKPCKVTAAGFADVNLRAFMKIVSTAWSYFALLQTIYGSRT